MSSLNTVVNTILSLLNSDFQGETSGKFVMARSEILAALGIQNLPEHAAKLHLTNLEDRLNARGITMFTSGAILGFIKTADLYQWRQPPSLLWKEMMIRERSHKV